MAIYHVRFSDDFKNDLPICEIEVKSSDGVILNEYKMTMDNFIDAIMSTEIEEEMRKKKYRIVGIRKVKRRKPRFVSPMLPKNCIRHVWVDYEQDHQCIFIEVPKNRWDIQLYDTKLEQVGFPRLIFGYQIRDNKVQSMYIFAVKGRGKIKGETPLYKYPFGNVSLAGVVCMGANRYPDAEELTDLGTYHNVFFAAPGSICYYDEHKNDSGIRDLRELYVKLQNQDFPEEWLKPQNMTFDEFIDTVR